MVRRFLVPAPLPADGTVTIGGEVYRHMARVLRLKVGNDVLLADGTGAECPGTISRMGKEDLTVTLRDGGTVLAPPPSPAVTLYQGLPKGEKLDFILQKATELGAAAVVLFSAERSVKKVKPERENELLARCQRIAREAARQSGSTFVPKIALAPTMRDAVAGSNHSVKLLLWEDETTRSLRQAMEGVQRPESVGIVVGPEGGITREEVADAMAGGYVPVSLGHRVLRTETAGMAILSIVQFQWGDIGDSPERNG